MTDARDLLIDLTNLITIPYHYCSARAAPRSRGGLLHEVTMIGVGAP